MSEGLSPVVGVILMIAITMILAAIIVSFVLGMTGKVSPLTGPLSNSLDVHSQGMPDVVHVSAVVNDGLSVRWSCEDRVVCFVVLNAGMIAPNGGDCFFNETFLLNKYCPGAP